MDYMVSKDGQQQGPYTLDQIISLVQQGLLSDTDLVFTQGWEQWKTIGELTASAGTVPVPKKGMSKLAKGCLIAGVTIVVLGIIGFVGCVACAGLLSSEGGGGGVSIDGKKVSEGRNIEINETLTTDDFEITITKVLARRSIGDPNFLGSRAADGGIYVCVLWTCKNISKESQSSFSVPRLNLYDKNGNKYDTDIGASGSFAAEEKVNRKILSDLNPGITQTDSDVFEISESILQSGGAYLEFDDAKGFKHPVSVGEGDPDPEEEEGVEGEDP